MTDRVRARWINSEIFAFTELRTRSRKRKPSVLLRRATGQCKILLLFVYLIVLRDGEFFAFFCYKCFLLFSLFFLFEYSTDLVALRTRARQLGSMTPGTALFVRDVSIYLLVRGWSRQNFYAPRNSYPRHERFERYVYTFLNNKNIDSAFIESGRKSTRHSWVYFTEIAEANAFYPRCLNARVRQGERSRGAPRYSILQDDTKRERYLSSSSALSRSFYSALRDQIEQTFLGNGLERRF